MRITGPHASIAPNAPSAPSAPDAYTEWELHKLAVTGLRRACIAGMLGFPPCFVADLLVRAGGPAGDGLGAAAIRVAALTATVALVFALVRVRGFDLRRPFLVGAVLMLAVCGFCALAAAPTGGFVSPYAFGLVPAVLSWALLMPGGMRQAIAPIGGGFSAYVAALLALGVRLDARGMAALYFQLAGAVTGVVSAEIVERWRRRSARESITDWLTGVMTRRYFLERLGQMCELRRRHPSPVTVVMFDVDLFKDVNDRFGHSAGDDALRTVAAAVGSATRMNDLCGRYGGDEFVLALDECDAEQALAVVERLRGRVAGTPVLARGARIHVRLSAGIATSAVAGHDAGALLDAADAALMHSKEAGRDRASVAGAAE